MKTCQIGMALFAASLISVPHASNASPAADIKTLASELADDIASLKFEGKSEISDVSVDCQEIKILNDASSKSPSVDTFPLARTDFSYDPAVWTINGTALPPGEEHKEHLFIYCIEQTRCIKETMPNNDSYVKRYRAYRYDYPGLKTFEIYRAHLLLLKQMCISLN